VRDAHGRDRAVRLETAAAGRDQARHHFRPAAGRRPAPHQHGEDEFFFVLEGTAEFLLDEETARGTAYSSFYCPPNRLHGIRNAGADTLKYLVIKKYPLINQPDAFIDRVREEHQGNGIVPMRVPPD
jgi:quercetin dioxygenase-like cupin family protein